MKKRQKWMAIVEGKYLEDNSARYFGKGPFDLNLSACGKLCESFGLSFNDIKRMVFVSNTSPSNLEKLAEFVNPK